MVADLAAAAETVGSAEVIADSVATAEVEGAVVAAEEKVVDSADLLEKSEVVEEMAGIHFRNLHHQTTEQFRPL